MSIQAVAWALTQRVTDPAAKLVLIALANAYNQQRGRCFPTVRQIMEEASTSERTVQRKLRTLAQMGLIEIQSARDDNGRQTSNEYVLRMNSMGANLTVVGRQDDTHEGARLTGGGCRSDGGEGVTRDGEEGVNCGTPLKEPEETPEEKKVPPSAGPTPPASEDPKTALFREGVAYVVSALGLTDRSARSSIGKWLKACGDDPARVLGAIRRCRDLNPASPREWLEKAMVAVPPETRRQQREDEAYRRTWAGMNPGVPPPAKRTHDERGVPLTDRGYPIDNDPWAGVH